MEGENLMNERMFPFITKTWNPLGGECLHKCKYCWMKNLKEKFPGLKVKYSGEARIYLKELAKVAKFTKDDFVFVCDCTDLFGEWVPIEFNVQILDAIRGSPAKFLLLTKNPKRYFQLGERISKNCIVGVTIETNRVYYPISSSKTPTTRERLDWLKELAVECPKNLFVSVEPIMDFGDVFIEALGEAKPWAIAVGYDNYDNGLPEPTLERTRFLMERIASSGITVYAKTLREPLLSVGGKP